MLNHLEIIHTINQEELKKNPQWNMPYAPAIKVHSGKPIYISGVNAAPIYHSHPHNSSEFDQLDFSPENQAKLTMENLQTILKASGASLNDVAQLFIFIVDVQKHGDRIGKILPQYFGAHLYASTVIGVIDLITDPRLILEITSVAYAQE